MIILLILLFIFVAYIPVMWSVSNRRRAKMALNGSCLTTESGIEERRTDLLKKYFNQLKLLR